jgi:hypothetical protein
MIVDRAGNVPVVYMKTYCGVLCGLHYLGGSNGDYNFNTTIGST